MLIKRYYPLGGDLLTTYIILQVHASFAADHVHVS